MLILLTNDDGIYAPGLAAMYKQLCTLGQVEVVAPEKVQSATSHGITLSYPLLTQKVTATEFTGTAVDGRPADCVKLAVSRLLPHPPDLVVSGINSGANTGINVIYSGTVAAAIEAAFLGLPAVAVSLYLRQNIPTDYQRAAQWAMETIRRLLDAGLGKGEVATVNLPALAPGQSPAGTRVVRQCTRSTMDTYEQRQDPRGRDYYWNSTRFNLGQTDVDTDVAALREGYITVTPLEFDLTRYDLLERWRKGMVKNASPV
ncbi:MAG TPA: 5'/3'-nucleotidase SurE [Tepidisphaeraceae bacterium]|nr:5'/3'-nucleotidase SurE [Tepidisphaeraceae bacterium]